MRQNLIGLTIVLIITLNLQAQNKSIRIHGQLISIEFDEQVHSRIISGIDKKEIILGEFNPSEYVIIDGKPYDHFRVSGNSEGEWNDEIGRGKQYIINSQSDKLLKTVSVTHYDAFPSMHFFTVTYQNRTNDNIVIDGWTNNNYLISSVRRNDNKPAFWSYEPGSYGWENDWIQPLSKGFRRDNYMGMNRVDYGGGTPVVDIWRQDAGLAVGHVEMVPKLVSLPVEMNSDDKASLAVNYKYPDTLRPGELLKTFHTFVSVHKGDHYRTLNDYSKFMISQGIKFRDPPKEAYGTNWCAWGYEKDFTMDQFYGTFPMVKKLGIDWIVLDYGWDTGVGDYYLHPDKFPNGEPDMLKAVDSIHSFGAKAKLWWMPLSAHPCTDLFQNHPENLLLNRDESPVYIEFWRSFFLCPASEEVQKMTKAFVTKAIKEWHWDGLKIDGNNLNTVPPCYNRSHHHKNPEESVEALPAFFKMIYETALNINPNVVIEVCPCGTSYSFYNLPYMNMCVASDPTNSRQARIKCKTLKALSDSKVVFFGDHVELYDNKDDFASQLGVGAVLGTKFIWPVGVHENKETGNINLTPEKETVWAKWINLYNQHKLANGEYLGGLYDIGYDLPETHAIRKDNKMYYAFYSPEFNGQVELRGLENANYRIMDYVNNRALGKIKGPEGLLKVSFKKDLLIFAEPITEGATP